MKTSYKKPKRHFDKLGKVSPSTSYFVPLENVMNSDRQDMKTMVDLGRYSSIFAPRQSGKTTFLNYFFHELENDPTYITVLLSFQRYGAFDARTFYQNVQKNLYSRLTGRLQAVDCPQLSKVRAFLDSHELNDADSFYLLFEELNKLIKFKKIVIFIDEFDGIPNHELENFLLTLRELYQEYKFHKDKALYSVGLIGIRNITKLVMGGVSPFNIADQVRLPSFTPGNIRDLYAQYTEETNQPFEEAAVRSVFEETGGQPWLVNRLGAILTVDVKPETTEAVTSEDVDTAIDHLLMEDNNHFDNLSEKIKACRTEFERIALDDVEFDHLDEEHSFLRQYGVIKTENRKAVPWLSGMQVVPKDGAPLMKGTEYEIEEAFAGIAEDIVKIA